METETITIPVDPESARSFYEAPPEKRRQLELMLRLRLYLTRLISDVVTGKIDVRNLAPPLGDSETEEYFQELEPFDGEPIDLDVEALAGEFKE
jgi:hypothetical protein